MVFATSLSLMFRLVVRSADTSSGNTSASLLTLLPVNAINYNYKYSDFPKVICQWENKIHSDDVFMHMLRLVSISLTATFSSHQTKQPSSCWPWSVPCFFGGLEWSFSLLFVTSTKIWLVKNPALPVIILGGRGGKLFLHNLFLVLTWHIYTFF